jgi:hypothetical protein
MSIDTEPLTIERARDLARRGFQPIEIETWEPGPEPHSLVPSGRKSPRQVAQEIRDVLGEFPTGLEEGLHVFPSLWYGCANCPTQDDGEPMCTKYEDHYSGEDPITGEPISHCKRHTTCKRFEPMADAPWPDYSRIVVFSVRGSSEGDYVHVESFDSQGRRTLVLLAKTFSGRDAAWQGARDVADCLGV